MMGERLRLRGDQIFAALICLLFVAMVAVAMGYPSEPRLLPSIIGTAGACLSGAVALGYGCSGEAASTVIPRSRRLAIALLAPPAYFAGLWFLGHWAANFATITIIATLLGYRRIEILLPVAVIVTVMLGIIFPLLQIRLPTGHLFSMLF